VPFRLLGLAAEPDRAGDLCGQTFPRYAASGTDITLVCAAASPASGIEYRLVARRLGVRDLVLLDYDALELNAAQLQDVFADLMASVRPHVVVADARQPAIREASATAFTRTRAADVGSGALPAKLYYRASTATPAVELTTAVAVPQPPSPELFVRVFPRPWVTGVLERDLFAGVPVERQPAARRERLAS
jgi:LmbE family N-acetylglucosaminyl deacetylase